MRMTEQGTLWIDVDDLFEYATGNARPSGIQRLAFELYSALVEAAGPRIRFVRLDRRRNSFAAVGWADVEQLFRTLTDAAGPPQQAAASGRVSAPRRAMRRVMATLPMEVRLQASAAVRQQIGALRAVGRLLAAGVRAGRAALRARGKGEDTAAGVDLFEGAVRPGDVLLALGSPWSFPGYGTVVAATQARFGVTFGVLLYDIIPLRRPEWCSAGLVRLFGDWIGAVLPLADHLFAISRYTADDVTRYAAGVGMTLRDAIRVIPVGAGFGPDNAPAAGPAAVAGPYCLVVSTIEARKNHVLLFRVWRRLLEEWPAERVPTLVFAGRVGWLVQDLMQQIDNANHLGGKLVVLPDVTDATLAGLYRGCLFTLFPSFYEGWGLPVTESLAFGKPCIASGATSLPEAGGAFCRYIDPDDLGAAYAVIRDTIADPEGLADWAAAIGRDYRRATWRDSAAVLLEHLP